MLAFVAFTFLESLTFDSSIPFVFKGFTDDAPSKGWSTYYSCIRTDEVALSLCIFLNLFSRQVVGSASSNRINAELSLPAKASNKAWVKQATCHLHPLPCRMSGNLGMCPRNEAPLSKHPDNQICKRWILRHRLGSIFREGLDAKLP
jgi:hypothetical protein